MNCAVMWREVWNNSQEFDSDLVGEALTVFYDICSVLFA